MDIYRIIVAALFILAGLAWLAVRILGAFAGEPDGPLGGWPPILGGLGLVVVGVLILIF